MLYKFNRDNKTLEKLDFYNFKDLDKLEKDLENLMVENIKKLFLDNTQIMTIFQEVNWRREPDICAIDKDGNLILFELKREVAGESTTIQILEYAEIFGKKTYKELNKYYSRFLNKDVDLAEEHREIFELDKPLKHSDFNQKQKLIIVGNAMDINLIESIDYWEEQGGRTEAERPSVWESCPPLELAQLSRQ